MEHVRTRDGNSSPPIENSTAPLIQTGPASLTLTRGEFDAEDPALSFPPPPTANTQCEDKSFQGFERPSFPRVAILTLLCLVTYPAYGNR